jgi:MFS family permease
MKKKIILSYILLSCLYAITLSFNKTTFVLFFYDKGFTKLETNLIFSVFNFSTLIFEPLASPISEVFSKKLSFIIGCFLKIITTILFISGNNIYFMITAEVFSGLAAAFISGTLISWFIEKLKEINQWEEGYKILNYTGRFKAISTIIGGISGAYIGNKNLVFPWIASLIFFIILTITSYFIMDKRKYENSFRNFPKTEINKEFFKNRIINGYKLTVKDKIILLLIISSFVSEFSLTSIYMFRLPIIKQDFQVSQITLGYLWFIIEFAKIVGSFFVISYYKLFDNPIKGLIFLPIISFIALIGAKFYSGNILMLILLFIFEFLEPFYNSLKNDILNTRIENIGRVTILSFENTISKIGNSLGLICIGYIADIISINFAWYLGSTIFTINAYLYYLVYKKVNYPTL